MKKKTNKIVIEQLENVAIESIIQKYKEIMNEERKSLPREIVLYHKIVFLVHLIISKCKRSRDNKIQLHAERLKNVLGPDYAYTITALTAMDIIKVDEKYLIGVHCRIISLVDWNIKIEETSNKKVIEYVEKWERLGLKVKEEKENDVAFSPKLIDGKICLVRVGQYKLDEDEILFRSRYEEALSCLRLRGNKQEAQDYVDSLFPNKNIHQYYYYTNCIQEYDKNKICIYSIDKQNRIYHFLTSLPKKIKKLYNIKYQLDIANSHPLLLSKILIDKYKIEISKLRKIYNIHREEYKENPHSVSKQLYNEQNMCEIHIPEDVIKYLYVCSKGLIWDDFATVFPEFTRDEVKVKAFKEIFYPARNITEFTQFGQKFIELYPNVHATVRELKDVTKLPNLLMTFESKLMRQILKDCYARGWKVVNIHDAVIVFDVEENSSVDPIDIKKIINDVYRKYLLHPTIHYEAFE